MLNIEVSASDQELAARLALAATDLDADRVDSALEHVHELGLERAVAVLAVQTRNLAATLVASHGVEAAQAVLQRTILDAQAAGR